MADGRGPLLEEARKRVPSVTALAQVTQLAGVGGMPVVVLTREARLYASILRKLGK